MVKEIKTFIDEHKNNGGYIWKLAVSSAREDTQKTTLGMYWNVVRDIIFFIAYGFFITVVRGSGSASIEGMPRLIYLFTGLVGWYFINDIIKTGVKCIVKNKGVFTKIKFPILIIPTFETIAIFIKRIMTVVLLCIILLLFVIFTDYRPDINIFGVIYALGAAFLFGVAYTLFVSGFYTISKDFRELYGAIMRIQFYFVPIFWSVYQDLPAAGLPNWVVTFIANTPFIHVINSFRRAISLGEFPQLYSIGIFFIIVLILFCTGCYIQYRLRRIYADFV
ncbi:hypothetical protein LJB88_01085 [Erysipelotrichaceae bacterium OttesenSCG-928-M19]|nr:hypothetical protein [Erysipelotrichaceae bacterium OttesenSCG-928-M19]